MGKINTTQYEYLLNKAIIEDKKCKVSLILISLLVIVAGLIITSIIFYNRENECWRLFGGFAFIFFLITILMHYISYENRLKRYTKQNMEFDEIEETLFSGE
jgi:hypothetical protein